MFFHSDNELRGVAGFEQDPEHETEILGEVFTNFFHDSNAQLVIDLDLFKELWEELHQLRESALVGNVDYVKTVVQFFEPLKSYDVSAPCIADLFHFLWAIYNYARTVERASYCDNCTCTAEFKKNFSEYQWIFDGK